MHLKLTVYVQSASLNVVRQFLKNSYNAAIRKRLAGCVWPKALGPKLGQKRLARSAWPEASDTPAPKIPRRKIQWHRYLTGPVSGS